jgi:hypothetical protein
MRDICLSFGVVAVLAAAAVLTGRAMAGVFRIRLLRRPTPENWIASLFLGTAVLTLGFGTCSYLGLRALPSTAVTATLCVVMIGLRAIMRPTFAIASARRWLTGTAVAAPCLLGIAATLSPLIVGDSFCLHNDSWFYNSVADWLQSHGFSDDSTLDPQDPVDQCLIMVKSIDHRMGVMFLLALVRSVSPVPRALYVYPAVMAYGVGLGIAGVYLLSRWAFRCTPGCAFTAALLSAGVNPLIFSAHNGFFSQVYGTAALSFSLAVLGRLYARPHWTFGGAVLLAAAVAFLVSMYSELSPFLAVALLVWLPLAGLYAWHRGRLRRYLGFVGCLVALLVLFAHVELLRAVHALRFMVGLSGVGRHFDWSSLDYWSFASGARDFGGRHWWSLTAVVIGTALFGIGAARGLRARRAWPVLQVLLVLASLAAYYHWCVRDPWTHAIGQTWNQFKLCKWSYALIVSAQAAGLHYVLSLGVFRRKLPRRFTLTAGGRPLFFSSARPAPWGGALLGAAWLTIFVATAAAHWSNAKTLALGYQQIMGVNTPTIPFSSARSLRNRVGLLGASSLYFIPQPDVIPFHFDLIQYLLYPLKINKSQPGSDSEFPINGAVGLMVGAPPFAPSQEALPCGLFAVDLQKPFVVGVGFSRRLERNAAGEAFARLDKEAVMVEFWTPRAGEGKLSFDCVIDPNLPTKLTERVLASQENGPEMEQENGPEMEVVFKASLGAPVSLPITARAGLNHLKLRWTDASSQFPKGASRPNLLYVMHLRFAYSGGTP